MVTTAHLRLLDGLPTVGLQDVMAQADLQVRTDRKYLVPPEAVDHLLTTCGAELRALTIQGKRVFRYKSVYFDTPDLVSYHQSARRRPRRFKVRIRTYDDTDIAALEVKVRDARRRTVKHRHPHPVEDRDRLTTEGQGFIGSFEQPANHLHRLAPTLATSYHRSTLIATGDETARVTIDIGLAFEDLSNGNEIRIGNMVLIETKTPGHPSEVDRALWRAGHRPVRISKYGTGLAALRPNLAANKWNRMLRRYFDWPCRRAGAHGHSIDR